jgi:beta-lactamase regulating signal transducer with metallopeptidase domain
VQEHEQAHVDRRDTLKKLVFSFLSSFLPSRVAQPMRQAMSLCMEQCADECAVSQGRNRADVAMTLIKVTKLMRSQGAAVDVAPLQSAFGDSEVYARVAYLLRSKPACSAPTVLMIALFSSIALLCLFSVDRLHHVIETLFTH